ncbi:C40 family peptidase [Burkholderia anthina]|nr:C40 family peptidase [Burkholderia anthina]
MNAADVNRYIGLPWVSGAIGPDAFDCWGLLRWVQRVHFATDLPARELDAELMRDLYQKQMAAGAWRVISMPAHGCGALLRGGDRPHVGVYLAIDGGGVLHAQQGVGVIFTSIRKLKMMGYSRVSWYDFISRDNRSRA